MTILPGLVSYFRLLTMLALAGTLAGLSLPAGAQSFRTGKGPIMTKTRSTKTIRHKQEEMATFRGPPPVDKPKAERNAVAEAITRNSNTYRGSMMVEGPVRQKKRMREKSREVSAYRGNQVNLAARAKLVKRKSKEISSWRGNTLVKRGPAGSHPSSAWRGSRIKNSFTAKEKYRKRMLKRINRNKKAQMPRSVRERDERPTYDSRESEIWEKPRGPEPKKRR